MACITGFISSDFGANIGISRKAAYVTARDKKNLDFKTTIFELFTKVFSRLPDKISTETNSALTRIF